MTTVKMMINKIRNFFRKRQKVPTSRNEVFKPIYSQLDVSSKYMSSYDDVTRFTGLEMAWKAVKEIEAALQTTDPTEKEIAEMLDNLNSICHTIPRGTDIHQKACILMERLNNERSKSRGKKSSP